MSTSFRDIFLEVLEEYRIAPPEGTREELSDTYPAITLEDAERVKAGLVAIMDAKDSKEQNRRIRDYKALHAELKRKYKKGGKH